MTAIAVMGALFTIKAQNPEHENALDFYYNKAYHYFYTNKDSAYFYFDKVKAIAIKEKDIAYFMETLISENWAANYHYDFDVVSANLKVLDSVMDEEEDYINTLPQRAYYRFSKHYSHALNNYELGDYTKALQLFLNIVSAIELEQVFTKDESVFGLYVSALNFIAKIYSDEAKYNLATHFLQKNERVCKNTTFDVQHYKNTITALLSNVYVKKGRYQDANTMLYKGLEASSKTRKNTNRIISNYQSVVTNHVKLEQHDSAGYYLKKMKNTLNAAHPFRYKYEMATAALYKAEGYYDKANAALQRALEQLQHQNNGKLHNTIAEVYMDLGRLDSTFSNIKTALSYFDLAANEVQKDSIDTAVQQTTRFRALRSKTTLLNISKAYKKALESAKIAIDVLDQLKPTFKNTTDKLFLIQEAYPVFESGIEAAYQLYTSSHDTAHLDMAFYMFEKSKSVLLLEALLNAKATAYGVIPKAILEEETVLKSKITHLEKQLHHQASVELEDALFAAKSKYRQLISKLELDYKTYYDLKYNTTVTSVSHLQNVQQEEDGLVSYFYGKSAIYGIFISTTAKHFIKIPLNASIKRRLQKFQEHLRDPQSQIATFQQVSFQLYKTLLKPLLTGSAVKEITVIPDGLLNYMPFSSLTTSNTKLKYLLEDYTVRYGHSVTTLLQLKVNKTHNGKLLSYAPEFKEAKALLLPLAHNTEESKAVLQNFKGQGYEGTAASLTHFKTNAKPYHIIHLATHAIFNASAPEYSFLAFTAQDSLTPHLLYIKDLYNLQLNANLVTLSACQSGIGTLQRGEGLMSLARGFYFSGAKSIASTLWNINDASAAQLMTYFYNMLAQGLSKPQALRTAKLEFLKTHKHTNLVHPYYWSAFIISGNKMPVVDSASTNWWWGLGGIAVVMVLVFSIKRRL